MRALLAMSFASAIPVMASSQPATVSKAEFRAEMRRLWTEHAQLSREFLINTVLEQPDSAGTADRLQQNQVELGNILVSYYGDVSGGRFTTLLRSHTSIAVDLINAARKGDSVARDEAARRWATNAADLSTFLHSANPRYWQLPELNKAMHEHLTTITTGLVARLQGNTAASSAAFDRVQLQLLKMSDSLCDGIIAQFPTRFVQ
jgi:hypothetical protein